jgi:hypothetical protein
MSGNGQTPGQTPGQPSQPPAQPAQPTLPPFPEFQAYTQKFQRMPDGETFRVVQFGAVETPTPLHIYISIGTMMQLVAEAMQESAVKVQKGWGERWNRYRAAADAAAVGITHPGVMRLDGKDNLNRGR